MSDKRGSGNPRNALLLAVPVGFIVLAGVFLFGLGRSDPDTLPSALKGKAVPEVALPALAPEPGFGTEDLRAGEGPVLVNIWATWCPPCRAEHPFLMDLAAQGETIYGINYKDDPSRALQFLEELGNPYAGLGSDPNGRAALDWGVYGLPETFLISQDGHILMRHAGPLTRDVIHDRLLPALEAAR